MKLTQEVYETLCQGLDMLYEDGVHLENYEQEELKKNIQNAQAVLDTIGTY